jgi:hypothetical protein
LADDFALTGIKYQEAGKFVVVINATNRQITLCHEHSGSGNTKRLYLSELANLTLGGTSGLSVATFLYTVTPLGSRWLLVSARSNSAVASTRAK